MRYYYDEIYRKALPRDPGRHLDICFDVAVDRNFDKTYFENRCGVKKS